VETKLYHESAKLARGWARATYSQPIPIDRVTRMRVAVGVYFACRSDGKLLYIGSAARPRNTHGVAKRIFEHPLPVRGRWWSVWILPLYDDTPRDIVHAIEGQIIDLLRPPRNRRRHAPRIIPQRNIATD
jgi:hypothetical protein